jgi:hypothetical protein
LGCEEDIVAVVMVMLELVEVVCLSVMKEKRKCLDAS